VQGGEARLLMFVTPETNMSTAKSPAQTLLFDSPFLHLHPSLNVGRQMREAEECIHMERMPRRPPARRPSARPTIRFFPFIRPEKVMRGRYGAFLPLPEPPAPSPTFLPSAEDRGRAPLECIDRGGCRVWLIYRVLLIPECHVMVYCCSACVAAERVVGLGQVGWGV